MSERTAIYRLFAADDTLLYVGIAKRFGARWEKHAKVQPWWPYVDHQTVSWCDSREDARLAEKQAMESERPVYNIAGSPWEGGVMDDGTGFYVIPKATVELRGSFEYDARYLVGNHEIAGMLGVSRQRVNQLARERRFPEPFAVLHMGNVWQRSDVEAWIRKSGRAS